MTPSLPRIVSAVAAAALVAACGDEGARPRVADAPGDATAAAEADARRFERWAEERPDEPVRAAVGFGEVLSTAEVSTVLAEREVRPYRAFVRVAGLTTAYGEPPSDASLPFLDELGNRVTTALETALCAQRGRAAAMLERNDVDRERGLAVLVGIERSRAAVERLRDADAAYVYGVEVEGTVPAVRSLLDDPRVQRVEPADVLDDGEVVVPEPAPPATAQAGVPDSLRRLSPGELIDRLRAIAVGGIEGCGPTTPPTVRGVEAGLSGS